MLCWYQRTAAMLEESQRNESNKMYGRPPESSGGESSSLIWLVLFSGVIVLSLLVNILFFSALVCSRKMSKTHLFLFLFFIINFVEYVLLVFEFSLGPDSHFPYSEASCSLYQVILQGNPLLRSGVLILFVHQAYSAIFATHPHFIRLFSLFLLSLLFLSLPSLLYSGLAIYPSGARHCVMDLGGVAEWVGMPMERQQTTTALYYLVYKPVLGYFFPFCLLTARLVKMGKLVNTTMDDQFNITLTITLTISYGVFHLPHATTMVVRHLLSICSPNLSYRDRWLLDVFQSFFLLLSYFSHLFMPMACLVMDTDILHRIFSYKLVWYEEMDKEKKMNLYDHEQQCLPIVP